MRDKHRVLWLLNHSTLRDFEVPLLLKLGMEVFVPKVFPGDETNLSASVTHINDATLSIPGKLLEQMNKFDFYTSDWPAALRNKINLHFDIAICAFIPKMLNALCEAFDGTIFLRAFGREGKKTYASLINEFCSQNVVDRIIHGNKIWFASAYSNISPNEPHWIRRTNVTLPLGLPDYGRRENRWQGTRHSLLFICPRIKTSAYYNQVYHEFRSHFGDLPHIVAGVQTEPVDEDPNVTGFIEDQEYQDLMSTCKVMFYHSREERHLHYHPIEAIASGMPVIFMAGGMLHYLAQSKLPGCCDTLEEARQKIVRILSGDQELITSVIESQKALLEEFDPENIEVSWRNRFLPIVESQKLLSKNSPESSSSSIRPRTLKVLIWCPLVNKGGGSRLLLQLVRGVARQEKVTQIRLAIPVGALPAELINPRKELPIELFWILSAKENSRLKAWLKKEQRILGVRGTFRAKRFIARLLFRDGDIEQFSAEFPGWTAKQFNLASKDCDLIYVFWPHRQVFPEIDKPVVCTFQDAIFFDFPEILGAAETKAEWERADTWLRNAAGIIVSSNSTKAALVRHFGAYCNSASVVPHAILPSEANPEQPRTTNLLARLPPRFIVCPANITPHKNHHGLLVAWSRFAQRKQCPLVLFGQGTEVFNLRKPEGQQPTRLAEIVGRTGLLVDEDFYALGYVDDSDVLELIRHATALIMPTLAEGGGSFPVEEALSLGVPVLCSDIPVLREHLAGRSAKIGWFDPESPDSIVRALNDVIANYDEYKAGALKAAKDPRPNWDDVARQYVDVFQAVAGLRIDAHGQCDHDNN